VRTFQASRQIEAAPSQIIELLTDPAAASTWSPVEFELDDGAAGRLQTGTHMEVGGRVAGRRVSFDLSILEASRRHLNLKASGPFDVTACYEAQEAERGTELRASVSVASRGGIRGRLVSTAAEALLAAGALEQTLERIARSAAAPTV
jgi:hypothetical protein